MRSDVSVRPRRGVAMFLVLGIVIFFTMLGFLGLQIASRDSGLTGTVLDIRSRDVASRSGISLALFALSNNPTQAATELGKFVADSSSGTPRQWMNFASNPVTLQSSDPGWYTIGSGPDASAVKVRVVSMDIGDATGAPSNGVRITFECTAQGRNADPITVLASYRIMGIQVPMISAPSVTNNFALYLNGALANSNMGTTVNGDVYINGATSLNGSAVFNVNGKLRASGDFTTNAPITVTGNSVIGGNLYTNGSAPMTFQKNLVIKTGITTMNANLTVTGNLDIQGLGSGGSWNSTAAMRVGGQFWYRRECRDIGGQVVVAGNAFFDSCMHLTTTSTDSFSNLYVGRSGGTGSNYAQSGATVVTGDFGDWHTPAAWQSFNSNSNNFTVNGSAVFMQSVEKQNTGQIRILGNAQFWQGIGNIQSASGIRVDGTTFISSTDQHGRFNGGMVLGNSLTMKGAVNSDFGTGPGGSVWAFLGTAPSKLWKYEGTCLGTGAPDPRVTSASTTNTSACNAAGSLPTPAVAVTAPTPVQPTAYATNTYTANDLDLSAAQTWNQPQTSDVTKVSGIIDLTTDSLNAAGSSLDNLTASDFAKIYARFKKSNGWMVVRVGASSPISALNAPGGTFTGKAMWIIEKSINVNGNWPGSTSSSDLQFIWVRTGGTLGNFGSPSNFAGYIRFEPAFNGQMSWGTVTLTGAIHFAGGGSSVTGNGSANLTVTNSQSVFDAISTAFPGVLADPSGSSSSASATSTRTLAARQSALQFIPIGEYR